MIPKTLTIVHCRCGYIKCNRCGFAEGVFPNGTGFDFEVAEEIKRRYDRGPVIVDE